MKIINLFLMLLFVMSIQSCTTIKGHIAYSKMYDQNLNPKSIAIIFIDHGEKEFNDKLKVVIEKAFKSRFKSSGLYIGNDFMDAQKSELVNESELISIGKNNKLDAIAIFHRSSFKAFFGLSIPFIVTGRIDMLYSIKLIDVNTGQPLLQGFHQINKGPYTFRVKRQSLKIIEKDLTAILNSYNENK